jgi:hypothetical protein
MPVTRVASILLMSLGLAAAIVCACDTAKTLTAAAIQASVPAFTSVSITEQDDGPGLDSSLFASAHSTVCVWNVLSRDISTRDLFHQYHRHAVDASRAPPITL